MVNKKPKVSDFTKDYNLSAKYSDFIGLAQYVVAHHKWRLQRGHKNPGVSFAGEKNPRKALRLAEIVIHDYVEKGRIYTKTTIEVLKTISWLKSKKGAKIFREKMHRAETTAEKIRKEAEKPIPWEIWIKSMTI